MSAQVEAVPRTPWRGRILAFVGIVLVALSLRTAVAAVSPILGQISHELPLSALVISVLGAVPPVAFAASGLLAPAISRRVGLDRAVLLAIGIMVLGHLGRALAPTAGVLLGSTIVTLLGVGVANVLLPPVVKRYFPDRIGLVSALYLTVMSFGASVPALIAVPVADTAGWRASLAIWFFVALSAAIPWIGMLRRARRERTPVRPGSAGPAGELVGADLAGADFLGADLVGAELLDADVAVTDVSGADVVGAAPPGHEPALAGRMAQSVIAWAMVGTFGAGAFVTYATFAWLPSILVDTAGLSDGDAGSLLALWAFMGFPSGILAPILAARLRNTAPLLVSGVVLIVIGYGGLLLAPTIAPVLWTVLAGLGPLLFPVTLALVNLRTRTHAGAVALSGFVQGIAYAIGALGPIVIGLLHDVTGGWSVPVIVIVIVGVILASPAVVLLARPRFVEDELSDRATRT